MLGPGSGSNQVNTSLGGGREREGKKLEEDSLIRLRTHAHNEWEMASRHLLILLLKLNVKCEGEQIVPNIARNSPVEKSYCEKEVNGTPSLDVDNER